MNEADLAIAKLSTRKSGAAKVAAPADPSEFERKILPLPTLAAVIGELRAQGRTIVLAHGTFDLLHIGHVRHLQAARRHGDVLVVTITADAFINKGPGRPVFPEGLRSEMLASLGIVDYVGVVAGPDALPAIDAVKPNVYVKGQDYRNPEGDITGRIVAEREAAEQYGGKVIFTEEITYSSTELINQHLNIFDSPTREHLDLLRHNGVADRITALMERAATLNVLVVGEAIIDEYRYVLPMGKAPKENIIATRLQDREIFIGGAVATANNAAAFCNSVELLTIIGERDSYEQQMRDALKPNVTMRTLVRRGAPTTHKCRYVDPTLVRKLFEVYQIEDAPLSPRDEDRLCAMFRDAVTGADVVIVNDFGHGMIGDKLVKTIAEKAPFLAINAQTNSANMGFNLISRYPRADLVCIDALEARLASKDRTGELTRIINETLPGMVECDRFPRHQRKARLADLRARRHRPLDPRLPVQGGRHDGRRRRGARGRGAADRGRRAARSRRLHRQCGRRAKSVDRRPPTLDRPRRGAEGADCAVEIAAAAGSAVARPAGGMPPADAIGKPDISRGAGI